MHAGGSVYTQHVVYKVFEIKPFQNKSTATTSIQTKPQKNEQKLYHIKEGFLTHTKRWYVTVVEMYFVYNLSEKYHAVIENNDLIFTPI